MDSKEISRSWFCVFNNPQEIYSGEPYEIAEKCLEEWCNGYPTRVGNVAYCISADGLHHLHMVLEDSNKARFSALKSTYPKAHLEPTKGTKEQAEDYINKRGKFQEKGEQVIYIAKHGDIKGNQGSRKQFEIIDDLIEQGKTPNEIIYISSSYGRYEKIIRDRYFLKRDIETSPERNVVIYWHVGLSGSGKSYTHIQLSEKYGFDKVYFINEYEHGFDKYNGEPILFMDEFRCQLKYNYLLSLLDKYKAQIRCRYTNSRALWNEVHITSILPPESVYDKMKLENSNYDTYEQLKRRINYVVYHYKQDDKFMSFNVPMSKYIDYDTLRKYALEPDWIREDLINSVQSEQLHI